MIPDEEVNLLLKVAKNPRKKSKMISYIHNHGLSEMTVARYFNISSSWFNTKLNNGLNKQDTKTVKKVVDDLYKKRGENK